MKRPILTVMAPAMMSLAGINAYAQEQAPAKVYYVKDITPEKMMNYEVSAGWHQPRYLGITSAPTGSLRGASVSRQTCAA